MEPGQQMPDKLVRKKMTPLEITEETLLADLFPTGDDLLKESWPLPVEDTVKEFELYLEEIGVRV